MTTAPTQPTILLDVVAWDLALDINSNIAMASPPYACAQDSASEIRFFQGDDYYDTTHGVPYFQQILGHWPPMSLVKTYLINAALLVPGIVQAKVFFSSFSQRGLQGQVITLDVDNQSSVTNF